MELKLGLGLPSVCGRPAGTMTGDRREHKGGGHTVRPTQASAASLRFRQEGADGLRFRCGRPVCPRWHWSGVLVGVSWRFEWTLPRCSERSPRDQTFSTLHVQEPHFPIPMATSNNLDTPQCPLRGGTSSDEIDWLYPKDDECVISEV